MSLAEWALVNPLPCVVEEKFDGIRIFLFKSGEKLVVSSKNGALFTPKGNPKVFSNVPELIHSPNRMILDGEYLSKEGLRLFDVLQVDDRDLRPLPLSERQSILSEILNETGLQSGIHHTGSIDEIKSKLGEVVQRGGEGIVCKNPLSTYGQTNSWLKIKRFDTVDCFVIDYEETQEFKKTGIPRSWFVGVYDENEVVNLGKVGSFVESVDPRNVKKDSVIEIRFQELTRDRKLRAPFIVRVRHDKLPTECLLSQFN